MILDSKCRLCRREGTKLFLKGDRCFSAKCPLDRKGAVPPGMHGQKKTRRRFSEYSRQLREKQKMRRIYLVEEKQFADYFKKAKKKKGKTAEIFFQLLESRLDNLVYRLGLAPSRLSARQLVAHGHVSVDGKRVNIPSCQVKVGQTISLSGKALKIPDIEGILKKKESPPAWLEKKAAIGKFSRLHKREEMDINIDDQTVIAYYSK